MADGEAVGVDPCISREEVERIAARAEELGARVTAVLATHADWDHVCGIAAFPEAEAAMGERTAELVAGGGPARRAEIFAAEHGVRLAGPPRVDRRLVVGSAHRVGPFVVETLSLAGHTRRTRLPCPRARRARRRRPSLDRRVPLRDLDGRYRSTLAALIGLLRHDPPGRVVSGTGPSAPQPRPSPLRRSTSLPARLYDAVGGALATAPMPSALAGPASPSSFRERVGDAEMRAANVAAQLAELRPSGTANYDEATGRLTERPSESFSVSRPTVIVAVARPRVGAGLVRRRSRRR